MGKLLELLLGPVGKWVAIAVVAVALLGTGFVKGIEWEQGKNAIKEREGLVRIITRIKTVIKHDNKVVQQHEEEKAQLREEMNGLRREYDKLRGELDKRDGVCDLPPPVLGVLNRARASGGPATNSGKPDATVRPLAPPVGWASGGSGKADDR